MSGRVLELRAVSHRFGARTVLSQVDLEVGPGKVVALVGANGSGKSTLLRIAAGRLVPRSGEVHYDGRPVRFDDQRFRALLGLGEERPPLEPMLTIRELVELQAVLRGLEQPGQLANAALDALGLTAHAQKRAAELSKGLRQRLVVTLATLHDAALVVLDEPATGLDPEGMGRINARLRRAAESGAAVLLATHDLEVAEGLDAEVAVLREGRIVARGQPQELRNVARIGTRIRFETVPGPDAALCEAVRGLGDVAEVHTGNDGEVAVLELLPDREPTRAMRQELSRLVTASGHELVLLEVEGSLRGTLAALEDTAQRRAP